jgi:hypothetical protein
MSWGYKSRVARDRASPGCPAVPSAGLWRVSSRGLGGAGWRVTRRPGCPRDAPKGPRIPGGYRWRPARDQGRPRGHPVVGRPRASALGAAAGGPARPVGSAPTPRVDGGTPVGSCAAVGRPGCRPSGSPPPRQPVETRIYTRCIGTGVVGLLWAPGEQTAGSRVDHETAAVQRGCGAGGWITISARGGSEGGRRQRDRATRSPSHLPAPRLEPLATPLPSPRRLDVAYPRCRP